MKKKSGCLCAHKELTTFSGLLKTMAEPNRLKIICLLAKGEKCVCEIMESLDLPHNLACHHLKNLAGAGLVKHRKEGRFSFYRLDQKRFDKFKKELNLLLGR